jgi:hypothetical protein
LLADDQPFFEQIGESSAVMDTNNSATFNYVIGQIDGEWDALGPPSSAGTVDAIAVDEQYVYVGGSWTNWGGDANADNVARYDKDAGTWSALSTGRDLSVLALIIDSNGDLIAGGDFTNMVSRWNGSSWSDLSTGPGGSSTVCRALALGDDGTIYAGTDTGVYSWDGSSWTDLCSDAPSVFCLAFHNGTLYAGGSFTAIDAVSANRIAQYDVATDTWTAMAAAATNNTVRAVAVAENGDVYITGSFTTPGTRIARFNGTDWVDLGDGLDDAGRALAISSNRVIAGGAFDKGGSDLADAAAEWNGSIWSHLGIDLPGTVTVGATVFDGDDLYLGFNTFGTGTYPGSTTVTPAGTAKVYPVITISRSGGTSATLQYVSNVSTGKTLLFDYDLLDGETLVIDLRPGQRSMTSSVWGERWKILPNSDTAEFYLLPAANTITFYASTVGAPTITAFVRWRDAYQGVD